MMKEDSVVGGVFIWVVLLALRGSAAIGCSWWVVFSPLIILLIMFLVTKLHKVRNVEDFVKSYSN